MLRAPTVFEDVVKTICTLMRSRNSVAEPVHHPRKCHPMTPVALLNPV
jgi:hypothetical protein